MHVHVVVLVLVILVLAVLILLGLVALVRDAAIDGPYGVPAAPGADAHLARSAVEDKASSMSREGS